MNEADSQLEQWLQPDSPQFPILCQETFKLCPDAFIDGCCSLITESGVSKFVLYPEQRRVVTELANQANQYLILLKARQIGMTWLSSAYAVWRAVHKPWEDIVVMSYREDQAKDILDRIRFIYDRLPAFLSYPTLSKATSTDLKLSNGSRIRSVPTTDVAGRSITSTCFIIDEVTSIVQIDDVVTSILPTIEQRKGQLILLSTASGIGDYFHRTWVKAETAQSPFKPIFLSWRAVPTRDDAWYDRTLKAFDDPRKMKQEYPATASEAFLYSGFNVFSIERLEEQKRFRRKVIEEGYLGMDAQGKVIVEPCSDAVVRIYVKPLAKREYRIGIDTSEGLGLDYQVAVVKDAKTMEQVAVYRNNRVSPDEFAEAVSLLATMYNDAMMNVELNNTGHAFIAVMKRIGYDNWMMHEHRDEITDQITRKIGWRSDVRSKDELITMQREAVREKYTKLNDEVVIGEHMTFVMDEKTKKMAGQVGCHDDCVIADALATMAVMRHPESDVMRIVNPKRDKGYY